MPLVAALSAGILIARWFQLELSWCVVVLGLAIVALLLRVSRWIKLSLITLAAGVVLYSARYAILSENDLRLIIDEKPALVTIRGKLLETPSVKEFPGRTNTLESSYTQIEIREILFDKQWRAAQGVVASTTRGAFADEWFAGRTVEVTGVIDRPKRAPAPGMFDYRQHLYNSRIFYQLRSESTNDWRLLSREPLRITDRFQRWAHAQLARGLPTEDEPLAMVRAMALGTRTSLSGEVADVFLRTGTMHIFAISGLHVACIAGCLLMTLRLAGVPRDHAAFILIPLIWFYTLATGWQSSAVRSALMSTFVFAGWAIRRPTELLNSTAGAALLILVVEPEQLFQASFQLSFVVVAAIALILGNSERQQPQWLLQLQDWLLRYDPLLPKELRPKWKRWIELPLAFFFGNLAISLASWIGSTPLTLYYFNIVTPISLIANLVAVPLSSISLAATVGSLLIPPLGPLFNYLSWATMWETIAVTRWLSRFSWGYFYAPKPNVWFFLLYLGVVASCLIPILRGQNLRRFTGGFLVLAFFALSLSIWSSARSTQLTVLPIPGNPILVDAPGRKNDLLIDCSNERGAEFLLKRFLRGQGMGSVRSVLLSHGDISHAGGLPMIAREFSPSSIFVSPVRARSRAYRDVLSEIENGWTPLNKVSSGSELLGWTVLHPNPGPAFPRAADNAVVLRKEIWGWKVLYLSDLGLRGQQALLERQTDLRADILVLGVSGNEQPIDTILAAVKPQLVVLGETVGFFQQRSKSKHKGSLSANGAFVINTLKEGAIRLELKKGQCRVTTAEGNSFLLEQ